MAPRGPETRCGLLLLVAIAVICVEPASAQDTDRSHLARAVSLLSQERYIEAMEVLREARGLYRETPLYPEILLQSARASLAQGETFRSRYFLTEILRLSPGVSAAGEAGRALGDLLYAERRWEEAYAAYNAAAKAPAQPAADLTWLHLRLAEIAQLELGSPARAREHLGSVTPALLTPNDRDLYGIVQSRSRWEHWPSARLGLEDPNISALALDEDDLWIGTWSGGLVRLERSSGVYTVFREGLDALVANTVRAICVTARHVWVGTDQGLSQYSKALSEWRTVSGLGGKGPRKVQAVREVGGTVYAATLGDGLFLLRDDRWPRLGESELPTTYITALGDLGGDLLVGTLDSGLWIIANPAGASPLIQAVPSVVSRNITAVLGAGSIVWVATYGEGVWRWDPGSGTTTRHTVASGALEDDWVMAVEGAGDRVYFGTFGGGVSYVGGDGAWGRLGLADGLASLDVMAILGVGSEVYFGTLGAGVSVLRK